MRICVLLCLATGYVCICEAVDYVIKNTNYGKVQGFIKMSLPGKPVEIYYGVPFAAPPIGELRYQNPVPPKPWSGVLRTRELPTGCYQGSADGEEYVLMHRENVTKWGEDCLYLNIYTPKNRKGKLPVLIYVHGGSNIAGMGAMLDGDVLAAWSDIIVVNFNYRLNFIGFLGTGTPDFPGNYGMFDQIEAFKWVQDNIEHFGGDKTRVTIDGHSAGSADVGLHTLSPLSKGLFRYSICQSGSPTAYWAIADKASSRTITTTFTKQYSCNKGNDKDMKDCLTALPSETLLNGHYTLVPGYYGFAAIVDDHFLTEDPIESIKSGKINVESFMMGVTENEGAYIAQSILERYASDGNFSLPILRHVLDTNKKGLPVVDGIVELVINEYTDWTDPNNATTLLKLHGDFNGDYTFTAPSIQTADLMAENDLDVFFYSFDYRSDLSPLEGWLGVPHGEDIFYIFGYPIIGHFRSEYNERDKKMSQMMMTMWGNFVKYGKPTTDDSGTAAVPKYSENRKPYLKLTHNGTDPVVVTDYQLRASNMAFWNILIPSLKGSPPIDNNSGAYGPLTWGFIALSVILLVLVILLVVFIILLKRSSDLRRIN